MSLSQKVVRLVEQFDLSGSLEWEDSKTKSRCYIFWKHPDEWADIIFEWVSYVNSHNFLL